MAIEGTKNFNSLLESMANFLKNDGFDLAASADLSSSWAPIAMDYDPEAMLPEVSVVLNSEVDSMSRKIKICAEEILAIRQAAQKSGAPLEKLWAKLRAQVSLIQGFSSEISDMTVKWNAFKNSEQCKQNQKIEDQVRIIEENLKDLDRQVEQQYEDSIIPCMDALTPQTFFQRVFSIFASKPNLTPKQRVNAAFPPQPPVRPSFDDDFKV